MLGPSSKHAIRRFLMTLRTYPAGSSRCSEKSNCFIQYFEVTAIISLK